VSASWDSWVGNTTGTYGASVSTLLKTVALRGGLVVVDAETKSSGVDVAVAPDEESTEDRLGQEIQDTVEDSLRVRGEDVSTLRKSPGDWVDEPKEDGPASTEEVGTVDFATDGSGVLATDDDDVVGDEEESSTAEDEVTPLVARDDEGTNETGDDHDFVHEDGVEDGGPWETSSEQNVQQKKRSSDDPVNVSNIEDLTVVTANLRVAAVEFNTNRSVTQVRGHGEVSNGGGKGNGGSDVVEDTSASVNSRTVGNEADS